VLAGDECMAMGTAAGGPRGDVRAASAVFVDGRRGSRLPHGIGARNDDCSSKSEGCFRSSIMWASCSAKMAASRPGGINAAAQNLSVRDVLGIEPHPEVFS